MSSRPLRSRAHHLNLLMHAFLKSGLQRITLCIDREICKCKRRWNISAPYKDKVEWFVEYLDRAALGQVRIGSVRITLTDISIFLNSRATVPSENKKAMVQRIKDEEVVV